MTPLLVLAASAVTLAHPAQWTDTAVSMRGQNGAQVTLDCPPNGRIANVWGSGVYTDDSSMCSAAAHGGFITTQTGGRITIEIGPGAPTYKASTKNGVTSESWGAWGGSFVVVSGVRGNPATAPPPAIDWAERANSYTGTTGPITVVCPGGGTPGRVWGTGVYTDDSSICTAAVHAGVITQMTGGPVRFELTPGAQTYTGSKQNGVTTESWGVWGGSFVLLPVGRP